MNPAIQDIYPLAPTQRGMLFHSLYEPASGVYVVQLGFTLRGELDAGAFEQAWQLLAQRHDVLRTAFAWDRLEAPVQVVGRSVRIPCESTDWRDRTADGQMQALDAWLQADRRRGFELAAAPLMRVHAFRLDADRHRIVCSYHHIVLDGWSLPLLLREWIPCYRAALEGRSAAVLPPAPRYRDYIVWLQQQDRAAALAHWRSELHDFTAPTPLGIDRGAGGAPPRLAVDTRRLPVDLTRELTAFARTHRVTTSTLIQGAWALVLGRYGDSTDIVYGLTRAGRPPALRDAHGTVGLFITTLPMRVRIDATRPVAAWLQILQQQQLRQLPHEHLPPVDVRATAPLPVGQPLFDSVVVFENYPSQRADDDAATLRLEAVDVVEQTHYPISLFAVGGTQLELKILYDAERIDAAPVPRLLEHLEHLLQRFCDHPALTLGEIDTLPPAQMRRLTIEPNRTCYPAPAWTAPGRIAERARRSPDAVAVTDARGSCDYAALDAAANRLAHHLMARGIGPGSRVGLCVDRSRAMPMALVAILRAGAAYVPLDAGYPASRLRHMVDDAGIAALLVHAGTRDTLAGWNGERIDLDADAPAIAACPARDPGIPATADDPAYLIYTSGSSGVPKGVTITHGNLANLLQAMERRIGIDPADRWLAVTTLSFDIAALEILLPLVGGATLVLADDADVRDAGRLMERIDAHGITMLQATPATWRMLDQAGWTGRAGLTLLCGGEALDDALARRLLNFGRALWNVYGPTETTIWSAALRITPERLGRGTAPIGHPLDNTRFLVLDSMRRPVPCGVPGELCIGGLGLSPGYHGLPDLTAAKFIATPTAATDDADASGTLTASPRLYRTGDRVRWRDDGTLDFLGRYDHQTKLRGHRIELEEIEAVLKQHPEIAQAVAAVQGDDPADARLVAYVTLTTGVEADPAQRSARLRAHVASLVPPYMVPAAYHVLPALPLTPNGKIDRRALRPLVLAPSAAGAVPTTPLEHTLLSIWRDTLKNDAVGLHDHFFEVGGHSLLVVNVQSRLRHTLQLDVSLVDLFRHPTVASLATHLEQRRASVVDTDAPAAQRTTQLAAGRQRLQQRREQQARTR
ncbi:MAG: amino acid adenylation domain-containing protein [Burkholderiales bacterium]|nr:amino acid adenylation domain-containing protein [Burkholderiales bacterium]